MQDAVLHFFQQQPQVAVLASLVISVTVAVVGVLPSVFVTAANILFFGFWPGLALSFAGEALGAAVAFSLYRKGFKKGASATLQQFKKAQALVNAEGRQAFGLVFSLRLLPFVPSGLVTFAAAIGRVSAWVFLAASSLGKIPALLLEGYAVAQVTAFGWQGKVVLAVVGVGLLVMVLKRRGRASDEPE